MIYLQIITSWTYLFVYKNLKLALLLLATFAIIYYYSIDNSQTYTNINNNNQSISKLINKYTTKKHGDLFFKILNDNKKEIHFYVEDGLNEDYQFTYLKKYKIIYIQDSTTNEEIFEIEIFDNNKEVMIKNIFNSPLNNTNSHLSLTKNKSYITYFNNNNNQKILLKKFFNELLITLTNEKNEHKISSLLNDFQTLTICNKHEVLLNVSNEKARISVLCK